MDPGDWVALVAASTLVLLGGVLVTAETAITRTTRIRALAWADEGRRGAGARARLLEHPERPLAVLDLLALMARATAATIVGIIGWRRAGGPGAVVAVLAVLAVTLVFGEMLPRRLAARRGDGVARSLAGPVRGLARFAPLAAAARALVPAPSPRNGNGHHDDEEAEAGGDEEGDEELDAEERLLIHSIFEFGDTIVREVMVPRTDMVTIATDTTIEVGLDVAIAAGFSRLPVLREGADDIAGLAYVKDLVRASRQGRGQAAVTTALRKAVFVPEQKRVAELLREMQTRKFHMAIVVDEYGATAGLVTLEDLLEEIVGEIVDEYDVEEPDVEELADGTFRVAGRTPVDEVSELIGIELPGEDWDTVGGLILDLVGHVPEEGESVTFQGIDFEVERVQGRRIVSARVCRGGAHGDRRAVPGPDDAGHRTPSDPKR